LIVLHLPRPERPVFSALLLRAAIEKMGQGARLIIATDNDPGGRSLADQIEALGREDLHLVRDLGAGEGSD
jgi:hypothetical protein